MKKTVFLLTAFLLVAYALQATNYIVGFTNTISGYTAKTTITAALGSAASGDTVKVAAGTFSEAELTIPSGVVVIGGYSATATTVGSNALTYPGNTTANLTILNGGGIHRVATVRGTLSNMIVRNGRTSGNGGGVLIDGGTVQYSIIRGNVALIVINPDLYPATGGGAYLQNGGKLYNSVVAFNMANNGFGVAGSGDVVNNTITSNTVAPFAVSIVAGAFTPGSLVSTGTTNISQFYIAQTETTNAQYAVYCAAVGMGSIPTVTFNSTVATSYNFSSGSYTPFQTSLSTGCDWGLNYVDGIWVPVSGKENNPMILVSWYGALAYSLWLNGTLPTEYQWEYAARKITNGIGITTYAGSNTIDGIAWYTSNSNNTQPVATKTANGVNIYDMSGNVNEWCQDWYGSTYPNGNGGPASGTSRVKCGGSWADPAASNSNLAVTWYLNTSSPTTFSNIIGFRPILLP